MEGLFELYLIHYSPRLDSDAIEPIVHGFAYERARADRGAAVAFHHPLIFASASIPFTPRERYEEICHVIAIKIECKFVRGCLWEIHRA